MWTPIYISPKRAEAIIKKNGGYISTVAAADSSRQAVFVIGLVIIKFFLSILVSAAGSSAKGERKLWFVNYILLLMILVSMVVVMEFYSLSIGVEVIEMELMKLPIDLLSCLCCSAKKLKKINEIIFLNFS